jgi:biotin transport system permease protein
VRSVLLGDYRPAGTWLHRLPAGVKLVALAVISVVLVVFGDWYVAVAGVLLAAALLLYAAGRPAAVLRALRSVLVVAFLLGAWQAWQNGWPRAVSSVGDLVTLVLLASVLTTTTPVEAILDRIVRWLRPFRRFGVDPELVGLAFSLMIRAIPRIAEIADETRDAALARGLQRDPRARLTPLVIRVVVHARATGDALTARGIADD